MRSVGRNGGHGVYLNLIVGQSARINRDTCSPCGGAEEQKKEEEERTGGNLISALSEHIRICGNVYADNRMGELSVQICTRVAETHGKYAARSRDSATTTPFMRITLFDVQKFRTFAGRNVLFLARFYSGQVSYTCGAAERTWRGYQTHVTLGRSEWFVVAVSKLTSCYYSSSDRTQIFSR